MVRRANKRKDPLNPEKVIIDYDSSSSIRRFQEAYTAHARAPLAKSRKKVVSPYFHKTNIDLLTPCKTVLVSPYFHKTFEGEKLQPVKKDAAKQDSQSLEETSEICLAQLGTTVPPRHRDSRVKKIRTTSPYFANKNIAPKGKPKKAKKSKVEERKLMELFPWRRTTLKASEKKSEAYRRKSADNKWVPPRSRHYLMQEDHFHDPWRVLIICMLLNVTTGKQTRQILDGFFERYPDAKSAAEASESEMEQMIRGLGLQKKRSRMIKRLSAEYLDDDWTYVMELHGVGKYAADAYAIFCNGMWDKVDPGDHKLRDYWMESFMHEPV